MRWTCPPPSPATVYCYTELTTVAVAARGSHPSRRPALSQYYAVASLASGRHSLQLLHLL